jgi:hypothetical protein
VVLPAQLCTIDARFPVRLRYHWHRAGPPHGAAVQLPTNAAADAHHTLRSPGTSVSPSVYRVCLTKCLPSVSHQVSTECVSPSVYRVCLTKCLSRSVSRPDCRTTIMDSLLNSAPLACAPTNDLLLCLCLYVCFTCMCTVCTVCVLSGIGQSPPMEHSLYTLTIHTHYTHSLYSIYWYRPISSHGAPSPAMSSWASQRKSTLSWNRRLKPSRSS